MRHALATGLQSHLTKLGAELPEPVARVIDRAEKLHTAANDITNPGASLVDAFAAAVDAGRDPATDKAVIRAIAEQQLAGPINIVSRVENSQTNAVTTIIREYSDDLVAELQRHLDTAVDDLTAAHDILGDIDPDQTATVLRMGTAGAEAWSAYQRGVATIATVEKAWRALMLGAHNITAHPRTPALIWADPSTDHTPDTTVYDLVKAGTPVTLATARTYRQRVEQVSEAKAQAAAAQAAAARGRRVSYL